MPKVIGIIAIVLSVILIISFLALQNKSLKSELALEKRIVAELSANLSQSVANIELAKAEAIKLSKLCKNEIDASKKLNLIIRRAVVKVKPETKVSTKAIMSTGIKSGIINYEISKDIIDYLNSHFN